MAEALARVATSLGLSKLSGGMMDYVTAAASGLIDGLLLASNSDAGAIAFLMKNIAVPIVDAALVKLPRGLVYHSVGQLGMIAILALSG